MVDPVRLVVQGGIVRHVEQDELRLVPVARREGKRGAELHVRAAARGRDHHVGGRLAAQAHGVAVAVGADRHVAEVLPVEEQAVAVVLDGDLGRRRRVHAGVARDGVREGDVLVGAVVVLQGGDGDGLGRIPSAGGAGREGERGGCARRALAGLHGDGVPVGGGHRDRQRGGLAGVGGELDVVAGGRAAFLKRHRRVVEQHARAGAVVVVHRHGSLVAGRVVHGVGVAVVGLREQGGGHRAVLLHGRIVLGGHGDAGGEGGAGELDRAHTEVLGRHEVATLADAQPHLRRALIAGGRAVLAARDDEHRIAALVDLGCGLRHRHRGATGGVNDHRRSLGLAGGERVALPGVHAQCDLAVRRVARVVRDHEDVGRAGLVGGDGEVLVPRRIEGVAALELRVLRGGRDPHREIAGGHRIGQQPEGCRAPFADGRPHRFDAHRRRAVVVGDLDVQRVALGHAAGEVGGGERAEGELQGAGVGVAVVDGGEPELGRARALAGKTHSRILAAVGRGLQQRHPRAGVHECETVVRGDRGAGDGDGRRDGLPRLKADAAQLAEIDVDVGRAAVFQHRDAFARAVPVEPHLRGVVVGHRHAGLGTAAEAVVVLAGDEGDRHLAVGLVAAVVLGGHVVVERAGNGHGDRLRAFGGGGDVVLAGQFRDLEFYGKRRVRGRGGGDAEAGVAALVGRARARLRLHADHGDGRGVLERDRSAGDRAASGRAIDADGLVALLGHLVPGVLQGKRAGGARCVRRDGDGEVRHRLVVGVLGGGAVAAAHLHRDRQGFAEHPARDAGGDGDGGRRAGVLGHLGLRAVLVGVGVEGEGDVRDGIVVEDLHGDAVAAGLGRRAAAEGGVEAFSVEVAEGDGERLVLGVAVVAGGGADLDVCRAWRAGAAGELELRLGGARVGERHAGAGAGRQGQFEVAVGELRRGDGGAGGAGDVEGDLQLFARRQAAAERQGEGRLAGGVALGEGDGGAGGQRHLGGVVVGDGHLGVVRAAAQGVLVVARRL